MRSAKRASLPAWQACATSEDLADTNVLLRAVLPDHEGQRQPALDALKSAEGVAVSVHSLCDIAWVLERSYGAPRGEIAAAIRRLMDTGNVVLNRPAVEAGLRQL
jgi:predicted nucleic-acid-binding protein